MRANIVAQTARLDASAVAFALGLLVLTVVGARLGYRLPNFFVPICLVAVPLAAALAVSNGRARIDPWALTFLALLTCHGALNLALFSTDASSTSFLLLAVLYAPFVVSVPASQTTIDAFYDRSLAFAVLIAGGGVAQFLLQFVLHTPVLFSWKGVAPEAFLDEFNTLNYLWWPPTVLKSNGLFFLESSLFGIFVARYLALAIALGKGWRTIAVLGAALLLSYSGTAWATFLVFLAFHFPLVGSARDVFARLGLLALLVCAVAVVFVLREPLGMDRYVARIEELTYPNEQTSGGGRFLAPLRGTGTFLQEASFTQLIFGDGPGLVEDRLVESGAWGIAGPWTKLVIEYGLVGCLLFVLLFCRAVLRSTRYFPLAIAISAEFLLISPSMLVPSSVYVILIGFCLFTPLEPSHQLRPAANSRFGRPVRAFTAPQR